MKKIPVIAVLLAFAVTAIVFAHKGEVHSYMGTITKVTANGFTLRDTKGNEHTFKTSKSTTYTRADHHAARRSDIKAGMRVVARIAADGETATSVKFAPKR